MQCRTCGEHGKEGLSSLDPEQASLLPQLAACSSFVCHDCVVEIQHWRHFLTRFQTSQTLFQQVLESKQRPVSLQQTDVEASLESILPKCRVLVAKLLQCDSCSFYTNSRSQLETHMQDHQVPKTSDGTTRTKRHRERRMGLPNNLICSECKILYFVPEMLAWHTKFCHGTEAIVKVVKVPNSIRQQFNFECVFCGTVCKHLHLIIRHLRSQHQFNNFPFHCDACDMKFIERKNLRYHLPICKGKKTVIDNSAQCNHMKSALIICKMCSKKFKTKELLNQHISHFHAIKRGRYACLHCEETFESIRHLKSHCDSRHPGKHVAQCDICNTKFTSILGYKSHKKYKHLTPTLTCNICSATFSYPQLLKQHMRYVHSQETWQCKICSATFKCERYLVSHVANMHSNPIFYCQHCSYSTRRKQDLVNHVKYKHSVIIDKTHFCQLCDATFKCRRYLLQHVRNVHTGPVLHCNHCKFSTRLKSKLSNHLKLVHSQLKKTLSCNYCGAKFKCQLYLKNHIKYLHTGPIIYCKHCNYTTRRKYCLVRHLKKQHI